jgi:nucleotide sugar dehydrogenase
MIQNKIRSKSAKICVIGLGYVGLPTSVFFAEKGFNVIGVDVDKDKVQMINSGISPLEDLNIGKKIKTVIGNKKLSATTNTITAVAESDIILIIVPTPVTKAKEPDLSFIIDVAKDISKSLHKNQLVILESTTYPGTTEEVLQPILEKSGLVAGADFGLAYCPERCNPGDPEHTLENVARVVGGITPEWGEITKLLYQNIINENVIQVKNIKTAEAAKIIENIQRDLNIALMNELALIFERMNIDIMDVIEAASTKWNFGRYYPGPGVGGHCLPVDPYYLTKHAQELGYHAQVILAGRKVNDDMPLHVYELVQDGLNEIEKPLINSNIVVLGATYKANTADVRNSPSEVLVKKLKKQGANVSIIEPNLNDKEIFSCRTISFNDLKTEIVDCIVLMANHKEFESTDMDSISVNGKVVFVDGCRVKNPENIKNAGFIYRGVGAGGWN